MHAPVRSNPLGHSRLEQFWQPGLAQVPITNCPIEQFTSLQHAVSVESGDVPGGQGTHMRSPVRSGKPVASEITCALIGTEVPFFVGMHDVPLVGGPSMEIPGMLEIASAISTASMVTVV